MHLLQDLVENYEFEPIMPIVERADTDALMRKPKTDRDELKARAKTTARLLQAGMQASMDYDEEETAVREFYHVKNQEPITPAAMRNPAIVLKLTALLSEYDFDIVRDAAQMRTYITNRLLEESDPANKIPKALQLQALKMLGTITEIGLFTERTEITVKQLPQETLEAKLYEKLKLLLPAEQDAEIISETKKDAQ